MPHPWVKLPMSEPIFVKTIKEKIILCAVAISHGGTMYLFIQDSLRPWIWTWGGASTPQAQLKSEEF